MKKESAEATEESISEAKEEVSKKLTQKEFEKMVLDIAKKGLTSEKIGEELKKQKIHPQEYDKKISKILKENNLYVSPDLKNVEEKYIKLKEHSDKNRQDKRALNEKTRIFSQIRKIKQYNRAIQ